MLHAQFIKTNINAKDFWESKSGWEVSWIPLYSNEIFNTFSQVNSCAITVFRCKTLDPIICV